MLYLPHLIIFIIGLNRNFIVSDLKRIEKQVQINLPLPILLLYFLHNNSFYRTIFYHRIGPIISLLISWWRPGNKTFIIPNSTKVGYSLFIAHPISTILNAESIGDNFSCFKFLKLIT